MDGSDPTTASTSGASVTIDDGKTIKVIATKTGYKPSVVATAAYTVPVCATPQITIDKDGNVTITCGTEGAAIHYTTDNTAPTSSSTTYSTSFSVANGKTVKAIATKSGYKDSAVAEKTYSAGGGNDPVTVAKTMNQIVSANNYTVSSGNSIGDIVTSFDLDDIITVSTSGDPNCGTFWGTGTYDWRLYQTADGDITISASSGYTISKVTITYGLSNGGSLFSGSTTISSGAEQTINASSVTYTVGSTTNKTNGQVKVTQISVTYK